MSLKYVLNQSNFSLMAFRLRINRKKIHIFKQLWQKANSLDKTQTYDSTSQSFFLDQDGGLKEIFPQRE